MRPRRVWQEVVDVMLRRIVAGVYPEGSSLPTEAELVEELGVSRPPVREAMKVLREKGLIRLDQGRRSTVLDRALWHALDSDVLMAELDNPGRHGRIFEDLSLVRIALEAQAAGLAARRATEEQLVTMRVVIDAMTGAIADPDAYLEHDVRFHALVIDAAGNQIARAIMQMISGPLRQSRRLTNTIPGGLERPHRFHVEIFERIEARDAEGAMGAMREHLEWSWRHYAELFES
jgi:DNA-binding FadR family transcriptional regulator